MNKLHIALFLLISTIFFGCSNINDSITYSRSEYARDNFTKEKVVYIDYILLTEKALESIFANTRVPKKIIVTDFVDLGHLENNTKLGYVMSNNIKNSLINKHHATVVEAEVSKYFKISENGLKILSRDISELRTNNFNINQAIVGTYTYTKKEIAIFIKLIDLETGIIRGSYAVTLPMSISSKLMLEQ